MGAVELLKKYLSSPLTCLRADLPTAPAGQAGTHRQVGEGRGGGEQFQ
jgi:hypothetical protein